MTTIQLAPVPVRRDASRVLASLDALTVLQRQVLVLHGAAGLSVGETARQLNLGRDAVRSIYGGACQRLNDSTSTELISTPIGVEITSGPLCSTAPEVLRGSPENPSRMTENPSGLQSCAPAQDCEGCPPWCAGCNQEADGARFHLSNGKVTDVREGEQPEVCLSRLDDDGEPGTTVVELFIGLRAHASLTPADALALAEVLRDYATRAAVTS